MAVRFTLVISSDNFFFFIGKNIEKSKKIKPSLEEPDNESGGSKYSSPLGQKGTKKSKEDFKAYLKLETGGRSLCIFCCNTSRIPKSVGHLGYFHISFKIIRDGYE